MNMNVSEARLRGCGSKRGWRGSGWVAAAAALVMLVAVFGGVSRAQIEPVEQWIPPKCGSDDPDIQCSLPRSLAANQENGHVFIADQFNHHRIVELNARGAFIKTWGRDVIEGGGTGFEVCVPANGDICKAGLSGSGSGELSNPVGIALDSAGNVYVVDISNRRVQKFDPSGNFLLMFGGDVNKTKVEEGGKSDEKNVCPVDPADECKAGVEDSSGNGRFGAWRFGSFITITPSDVVYVGDENRIQRFDTAGHYQGEITVPGETVQGLASDHDGNLYAIYFNRKNDIRKIGPAGEELDQFEIINPAAVTVDSAGHVYAFGRTSCCGGLNNLNPIIEFDPAGKIVQEFGKGQFDDSFAMATSLCPGSESPGNLFVANASATNGFVRAYGTEPIGCLKARTLPADPVGETMATINGAVNPKGEAVTECFFEFGIDEEYGQVAPCVPGAAEIGSGSEAVPVHADIGPLPKATVHHFRLIAEVGGETETGADESFKTLGPPLIFDDHVLDATEDEARLKALVNPEGFAASCHFDYGTGEAYGESTAAQAISKDGDRAAHVLAAVIPGLAPGTAYHWRVSCSNSSGAVAGPDHILNTYRVFGMEGGCANDAFRTGPAALLPDCRAYEMVSPVDKNGGNILLPSDGNVQSSPDGDRLTYNAIPSFGDAASSLVVNQYMATRQGADWSNHGIHPPAVGRIVQPGIPVVGLVRDFIAFTPDLCHAWLFDYLKPSLTPAGQADHADYYRRDNCEPGEGSLEALTAAPPLVPEGTLPDYIEPTWVQGASDDALHAILLAKTALTPDAAAGSSTQIYDHFGGANHLVSVLPSGNASTTSNEVGSGWFRSLDNAVSADGSRVYWIEGPSVTSGIGRLFLRLHPEQGKVAGECSNAASACTLAVSSGKEAFFWTASEDGTRALYTERTETTPPKLLEFDLNGGTPEKRLISENIEGVLGAAEDLSRVYFVSREKLTEEALEGAPNIYLDQAGALTYVTTLGESDVAGGASPYDLTADELRLRATRVSTDGSRLVFQSRAPLTGYDNTDQVNGKADIEVFAYEVGGELECVSCNPSGARPVGRELRKRYWSNEGGGHGVFAAAWIPAPEHPLHASNVVSADGSRILFNSNDALLPRDTNSTMDVYEWEAAGTGSCIDAADNPSYFPQNGGCLYLISTGESPFESEFWEADADGSDIFFTTESKLVGEDPGLVDLYDARVGGGFPEPPVSPDCEGEACQSPASPPAFSTPASRSESLGNPPRASKACPRGKRKVRRKGKVLCVKRKRNAQRKRRASNERRASR